MEKARNMASGLMWRVIFSILIVTAFLVGSILYVAFYTRGYSLFQQLAVVLVALILAFAGLAILWVTWAGRRGMMRWWKD